MWIFYFDFVKDEKLSTLAECHNKAFEYFGEYCSEGLYVGIGGKIAKASVENEQKHRPKMNTFIGIN